MTLSAKIEPSLRRAVFTSPSFLASGDVSEDLVLEFPCRAPDAAGLSLTLRREGPSGDVVAVASGFEAVERHSHMVSCSLSLRTSALDAWRLEDLEAAGADAKDRPSGPYRTAWLDVFDASSVYVSCAVPVLLRDVYPIAAGDGTVRYDRAQSISAEEAARARANISAASSADAAEAKSAADAAKSAAEGAASKADAAQTTADSAKSVADGAAATASQALSRSSDAKSAAASAETAAASAALAVDALKSSVPLLEGGLVPAKYLPSYVDDVLEAASKDAFPAPGESGKIYVALDTNLAYRWGGSSYVEVSPSLALGETASTAWAGDRGKALADDVASLKTSKADTSAVAAAQAAAEGAVSAAADARQAVEAHVGDTANPHNVSASQVGSLTEGESDARYFPLSRESELAKKTDLSGYLPKTGGTLDGGTSTSLTLNGGAGLDGTGSTLTLKAGYQGPGRVVVGGSGDDGGQITVQAGANGSGTVTCMGPDGQGAYSAVLAADDLTFHSVRGDVGVSVKAAVQDAKNAAAAAAEAKTAAAEAKTAAEGAVSSSVANVVGQAFTLSRTADGATATLKFDSGPSGLTVQLSGLYVDGSPFVSGLAVVGGGAAEAPILDSLVLYGPDGTSALSEVKALVAPVQAAVDALSSKVEAANAALEEVA